MSPCIRLIAVTALFIALLSRAAPIPATSRSPTVSRRAFGDPAKVLDAVSAGVLTPLAGLDRPLSAATIALLTPAAPIRLQKLRTAALDRSAFKSWQLHKDALHDTSIPEAQDSEVPPLGHEPESALAPVPSTSTGLSSWGLKRARTERQATVVSATKSASTSQDAQRLRSSSTAGSSDVPEQLQPSSELRYKFSLTPLHELKSRHAMFISGPSGHNFLARSAVGFGHWTLSNLAFSPHLLV